MTEPGAPDDPAPPEGNDPVASSAPPADPPNTLQLPASLPATWRRDWRLGRELIGHGVLFLGPEELMLTGRRSSVVRGLLLMTWRLACWGGSAALGLALFLTTIGLTWRSRDWEWLIWGPTVGLPSLVVLLWLALLLGRRIFEPKEVLHIKWAEVDHITTDGRWVELEANTRRGRVFGRMKARRRGKATRRILDGIELGGLPGGRGGPTTRLMRPVWFDRLVWLGLLLGTMGGAVLFEPWVSLALLGWGEPKEGPRAGIPDPLTAAQLEALTPGACGGGDPKAPSLRNAADGTALTWTVEGDTADWRLLNLRWAAGTGRMDVVGGVRPAADGRLADFLPDQGTVGVSLLVPRVQAETAHQLLATRDTEAFRAAWCSGLIARLDHTMVQPPAPVAIEARRQGRSLVVDLADPKKGDMLLPVRWHDRPGPDLFDVCLVPQEDGNLGMLPARPERTWRRFFAAEGEQARVYLVPKEHVEAVEVLARGGTVQRCLVPDSLVFAGLASAVATTEVATASLWRDQAAELARSQALIPVGATPRQTIDAVSERYKLVVRETHARARSPEDQRAINEGFLLAMDWTLLLDHLSFGNGIARLEVLRQRLSGADPLEEQGELFLMHLATAFLDRTPPEFHAYDARLDVGEEWMAVKGGHTWTLEGRTVRVPDQRTGELYQLIGRFVLMDVARRLEESLEGRELSLDEVAVSYYLRWRLMDHQINLDVDKSTARKGLEAWVTGDFEYLADRLSKKAAEQIRNEQKAIAAASKADYSLATEWSDGAAVRTSSLLREGRGIGWVAQFDQAKVDLGYVPVEGKGTSTEAISGGRTLFLATSGSYVTGEGRTAGLSVVDGEIRNYLLSPSMDGLVIVRGNGELAIIDLKRGGKLPGAERAIQPLVSLTDLHSLLGWLRRDGASAFQTHLLAHGGELTIDPAKSSGELRERRLLVQADYRGHPILVFVDIPGAHRKSLFEAAVTAWAALQTPEARGGPGLHVQAIANLDVGSYDILEAYDDQGRQLRRGPVGLGSAMNLLTVRR